VAELLSGYRTITYSRRYNFPNDNPLSGTDHSAQVEAADLAALNRHLRLGRTHVVGVSYGAYTAIMLALRHPEMVRTLTLVEPPLIRWLPDLPGGSVLFDQFYAGTWQPAGQAFRKGDPKEALRVTLDYFVGPGSADTIPAEMRTALLGNLREWQALTTSSDAFPPVSREQIRKLPMPVLMLSGGKTYPMLRLVDAELERQLAHGRRQVIPDGTHDVCTEQPSVCAAAIRAFLDDVNKKRETMTTRASGTFEVKVTPQASDDKGEGAILGRMSIDKQFHGDLEGTSKGEMLTAGTAVKGSVGYVAIEHVRGALRGRTGTFSLQHSGTMARGAPQLTITVVPDSGTGQLVGLAGDMAIIITDGKHSYDFEYTLPAAP
jgi:pimeloyl-ACP methyl ester carboxylesterase